MTKLGILSTVVAALMMLGMSVAQAAPLQKKPAQSADMYHPPRVTPMPKASDEKPFAEHFIVFHISSGDMFAQKLILNNAENIQRAYGPDKVEIEVVAYGPGLRALFSENAFNKRIKRMAANGIKFSACANTMRAMGRPQNKLHPAAKVVSGGVVRITELQEAGWTYIRP